VHGAEQGIAAVAVCAAALDGGPGADRIWCGAGTDTVLADAQDVIETPGACEEVVLG
jgi:hypothetical protein